MGVPTGHTHGTHSHMHTRMQARVAGIYLDICQLNIYAKGCFTTPFPNICTHYPPPPHSGGFLYVLTTEGGPTQPEQRSQLNL